MKVKIKRLIAFSIDFLPLNILTWHICDFFIKAIKIEIIGILLSFLVFGIAIYFFIKKDVLFGYESIGKKLMGLQIYNANGVREKNKDKLTQRVLYSLFNLYMPFYPYMILFTNRSVGDKQVDLFVREKK